MKVDVVRRRKGDLIERMEERLVQLQGTGKPFWPSSAQRYCTSDLKRDPINMWLRRHPYKTVVSAVGVRAQESDQRALLPVWKRNLRLCTRQREALTWHPIHTFKLDDVWESCGTSKYEIEYRRRMYQEGRAEVALANTPVHPAYVFGNERLSCALCVLGSRNDLRIGAAHNPEILRTYLDMEQRSGFGFRDGCTLAEMVTAHQVAAAYTERVPGAVVNTQPCCDQLGLF